MFWFSINLFPTNIFLTQYLHMENTIRHQTFINIFIRFKYKAIEILTQTNIFISLQLNVVDF